MRYQAVSFVRCVIVDRLRICSVTDAKSKRINMNMNKNFFTFSSISKRIRELDAGLDGVHLWRTALPIAFYASKLFHTDGFDLTVSDDLP